jgi:hypothetical protein
VTLPGCSTVFFFSLNTWALACILFAITLGATGAALVAGRRLRDRSPSLREPLGVVQAALLSVVGLNPGLRADARRRALRGPPRCGGPRSQRDRHDLPSSTAPGRAARTRALALLRRYTRLAIDISHEVPNSATMQRTTAAEAAIQRQLWGLAGRALRIAPIATAPRLYVDSLNDVIDDQGARLSALNNRLPDAVVALEVAGATVALAMLAFYLAVLGRALIPVLLAAGFVTMLLVVTFDLDRPTRGLITVPDSSPRCRLR